MPLKRLKNALGADTKNKHLALFITFLKASTFTFAGGLAVIPAIEQDAVVKYKLISKDDFMEYATLSQTLPGVIALNCATLVGRKAAGTAGMFAAGMGAIFPPFFFMVLATVLANAIPQEGAFYGAMAGIRAASAALVLSAAFSLGRHNLKSVFAVIMMLAAFFLIIFGGLGAPLVVIFAGVAGCLYQRIRRALNRRKNNAD